ncbi:MAG: DUF4954 family protein [Bacteroidales bacterium]
MHVGDHALDPQCQSYISNYTIESRVVIHNVNIIAVDDFTTFGNGVRVRAINEQGGREIPIYDHLTTHIAYILGLYSASLGAYRGTGAACLKLC